MKPQSKSMWELEMEVKIKLVLMIDVEEYPVPADELVIPELKDYIEDMFTDMSGVTVHKIVATQNTTEQKELPLE